MSHGDRQSFQACLPPGAGLNDEEFGREREKGRAAVAFAIVSKETVSEGEVILGVDLTAGSGHHRVRIVMKKLEGNWRCAGGAE
jgi:nitrogen fixation protein FixH